MVQIAIQILETHGHASLQNRNQRIYIDAKQMTINDGIFL